jgi:DNA polymerase-1
MVVSDRDFKHVCLVDFEFIATAGNLPVVVCMVVLDLVTGEKMRYWSDELLCLSIPPFPTGSDSLLVAYYASAEMNCFNVLGWKPPVNILDLFTEFRNLTNGIPVPAGKGLLGALAYFGLNTIGSLEKESMRLVIMRGGPWSQKEKFEILDYCESDVDALARLLPVMAGSLDIERALLRGRYMLALTFVELTGIPIDTDTLSNLVNKWEDLVDRLIAEIDRDYHVYEDRTFKQEKFEAFLNTQSINWPRLESGRLELKDDTFKEMGKSYPQLRPLHELRATLSKLRLNKLSVGDDGRNRCLLSAFQSVTGRNQPSTTKFIYGNPAWVRGLIKPGPETGIAYIDWSQQEFGIAAALSGDLLMQAAYLSGDPYLSFARQAGAVPQGATKQTHPSEREQFKACVLAVQYGMGAESLAARIDQPVARARELLRLHRDTYRTFWQWSDASLDYAMLCGKLWTVFGWTIHVGQEPNPRSLRNFPMQANGAEMLRLAIIKVVEAGIRVCAPVHDAILVEAGLDELDSTIETAQRLMAETSAIILDGFELRTDVDVVLYPERYMDPRGQKMWDTVMGLLDV